MTSELPACINMLSIYNMERQSVESYGRKFGKCGLSACYNFVIISVGVFLCKVKF